MFAGRGFFGCGGGEVPRDFDGLMTWLLAHPEFEGIVWHHPDGRMAKLKHRDARASVTAAS